MIINTIFKSITIPILLITSAWAGADDNKLSELIPDPKYSPAEVVSMQMDALKNNNIPYQDAGIEISFRFASPENKKSTGPIERFKLLFKNADYAPMLNHRSLEIGPVKYIQESANVPIYIMSKEGKKILYIFRLDKQTQDPCQNCWMTSGVIRIPTDSLEEKQDKPI